MGVSDLERVDRGILEVTVARGSSPGGAVGTREEQPWDCERTESEIRTGAGGMVPQGERLQK